MKTVRILFMRICYAYTLVVLLLSAVNWIVSLIMQVEREPSYDVSMLLTVFVVVAATCTLMLVTDKIQIKNAWLDSLIRLLDIMIVVLPIGWLLGWFVKPEDFVFVSALNTVVYAVVYLVQYFQGKEDANALNREIQRNKKKEENNGKNN